MVTSFKSGVLNFHLILTDFISMLIFLHLILDLLTCVFRHTENTLKDRNTKRRKQQWRLALPRPLVGVAVRISWGVNSVMSLALELMPMQLTSEDPNIRRQELNEITIFVDFYVHFEWHGPWGDNYLWIDYTIQCLRTVWIDTYVFVLVLMIWVFSMCEALKWMHIKEKMVVYNSSECLLVMIFLFTGS